MNGLNGFDYFGIALFAVGAIYGLQRGAVRMVTSVVSLANTLTAPPVPAGTMAALDLMRPSKELTVEATGRGSPAGHRVT